METEIKMDCPACGQRVGLPGEASGMDVMCPTCGRDFAVPRGKYNFGTKKSALLLLRRGERSDEGIVACTARRSEADRLRGRAGDQNRLGVLLLVIGGLALAVGAHNSIADGDAEAVGTGANILAICAVVAVILFILSHLNHIRAALESRRAEDK